MLPRDEYDPALGQDIIGKLLLITLRKGPVRGKSQLRRQGRDGFQWPLALAAIVLRIAVSRDALCCSRIRRID
jgi:hypothetical protein